LRKARRQIREKFPEAVRLLHDPDLIPFLSVFFISGELVLHEYGTALAGPHGLRDIRIKVGESPQAITEWLSKNIKEWAKGFSPNTKEFELLSLHISKRVRKISRSFRRRSVLEHRIKRYSSKGVKCALRYRMFRRDLIAMLWKSPPNVATVHESRKDMEHIYIKQFFAYIQDETDILAELCEHLGKSPYAFKLGGLELKLGVDDLLRICCLLPTVRNPSNSEIWKLLKQGNLGCWVTLGGAPWVYYTASHLKLHDVLGTENYTHLAQLALRYGNDKAVDLQEFVELLKLNVESRKLYILIEHPFRDRVLWEYLHGDNRRYAVEKIVNYYGLADMRKRESIDNLEVIWYRECWPVTGSASIGQDGNSVIETQIGDYESFGRSAIGGSYLTTPGWKVAESIEADGRGIKWERWSDNKFAKILLGVKSEGAGFHLSVKRRRRMHAHYVEQVRREVTLSKMLSEPNTITSEQLLRFNWFGYDHSGWPLLDGTNKMSIQEPMSWLGCGLLEIICHETDIAVTLFDFLSNAKCSKSDGNRDPEIELSLRFVWHYLRNDYLKVDIPAYLRILSILETMVQTEKIKDDLRDRKNHLEENRRILQNKL
jgi:hypothetical protein